MIGIEIMIKLVLKECVQLLAYKFKSVVFIEQTLF